MQRSLLSLVFQGLRDDARCEMGIRDLVRRVNKLVIAVSPATGRVTLQVDTIPCTAMRVTLALFFVESIIVLVFWSIYAERPRNQRLFECLVRLHFFANETLI